MLFESVRSEEETRKHSPWSLAVFKEEEHAQKGNEKRFSKKKTFLLSSFFCLFLFFWERDMMKHQNRFFFCNPDEK